MQIIKQIWIAIKNFCMRYDKIIMAAIMGSFFTMVVGIFVNYEIQKSITDRAHKFEMKKINLNTREKLFVDVFDLVKQRMFKLDRFTWAYTVESIKYEKLHRYWTEYVDSLRAWDIEYDKYKTQLDIYYSPELASEFSNVRNLFWQARIQVRKFWRQCASNQCTRQNKKKTITFGDKENIEDRMKQKINQCIQEKILININENDRYTIKTYIKCVVANTRNGVTRFSKELVQAHINKQLVAG